MCDGYAWLTMIRRHNTKRVTDNQEFQPFSHNWTRIVNKDKTTRCGRKWCKRQYKSQWNHLLTSLPFGWWWPDTANTSSALRPVFSSHLFSLKIHTWQHSLHGVRRYLISTCVQFPCFHVAYIRYVSWKDVDKRVALVCGMWKVFRLISEWHVRPFSPVWNYGNLFKSI